MRTRRSESYTQRREVVRSSVEGLQGATIIEAEVFEVKLKKLKLENARSPYKPRGMQG